MDEDKHKPSDKKNNSVGDFFQSLRSHPIMLVFGVIVVIAGFLASISQIIGRPLINFDGSTTRTSSFSLASTATGEPTSAVLTPTLSPTPDDSPSGLYATLIKKEPTISDLLVQQDGNNWQIQPVNRCHFENGAYHALMDMLGAYTECSSSLAYKDFGYQVQMVIQKGDAGGILFRDSHSQVLYFFITATNKYGLWEYLGSGPPQNLANGGPESFIKGVGQTNMLMVIAKRTNIYLYVNGQLALTYQDHTPVTGQIGMFAGDFGQVTDVAFNNLRVWDLSNFP